MGFLYINRGSINFAMGTIAGFAVCLLVVTFSMISLPRKRLGVSSASMETSSRHLSDLHDPSVHEMLGRIHGDAVGDQNARVVKFEDLHAHHDDDSVAKEMARGVRVLVWVMTSPQNLDKKAIHVQNTWGKRANTLLFMSSQWNSSFPTIGLNVSEGREHLTAKTFQAFRYIYEHHFDDADWFMKADDDTYVIMENLRYMLSAYDTKDPIYFGQMFKSVVKQGYASGGAGYVLSKEALRRMITKGLNNSTLCRPDGGAEDVELGKCLLNLGVRIQSSMDILGRTRFHCFDPQEHLRGDFVDWYKVYDANGAKGGIGNMSDYAVTFHYIRPIQMYELEYFIYHLRPFGILSRAQNLNLKKENAGS
ncbi:hypothetical protein ACOMHN_029147 [Nucella lapillus]